MKHQIPKILQEKIDIKFQSSQYFSKEIKQFMIDYANFYNWKLNDNVGAIFKLMKKGLSDLPKCGYHSCNKNVMLRKDGVISKGCCTKHSKKITNLENSGYEHNWSKDSELRKKQEETMMKKYGKHNFQHGKLREKAKQTMIEKYGVDHNWKKGELRERDNLVRIEKYGIDNLFGGINYMIKVKNTMIEKYGASNPQQVPEIFEKSQKTRFKPKEYHWNTGEISLVQGYEPIVLKELEEQGYKFKEVLTSPKDMPKIIYKLNNKNHRYYPDIFIPKDNIIIEVKSDYTLKANWDINQLKFEATKSLGFDFRLEVR